MKSLTTILFSVLIVSSLHAQENINIFGTISDKKTGKALDYAHIGIEGTSIGTVSNSQGKFQIVIPARYESNNLVVSYVGYESFSRSLEEINSNNDQQIDLVPSAINLPELVISDKKKTIVEEAIERIPINHDLGNMAMRAFWRGQIRNRDGHIQLSETVVDIFRFSEKDKPDEKKKSELKIIKGRISRDSLAFQKLSNIQAGVGPQGLFEVSFLIDHPVLSKKTLKNHEYEIIEVSQYDGREVFVVEFKKKEKTKNGYLGQIILEAETLAFVKIEYGMSPENQEDIMLFGDSKVAGMLTGLSKSTFDKYDSEINFQNINGKWYLSYVKYDADWTLIKAKQNYREPMYYYADFVVTEIKKDGYALPGSEEFAKKQILENQTDYAGANFWKDFNYIVPDRDFEKLFTEIYERNDGWREKWEQENAVDEE